MSQYSDAKKCEISPKYWCDSVDVATNCGVFHLCQDHLFPSESAKPVQVDLYYEALCPFCKQFITQQLFPTWVTLYKFQMINISLVPYGNAKEQKISQYKYNYTCQHGPDECVLNTIENCIMNQTDFDNYFPIINCIENSEDPIQEAKSCVKKGNLSWKKVEHCTNGSLGNRLTHEAAVKTSQLNPSHTYVPWIVVNGEHTESMQNDAQKDLLKLICDTYTGKTPKVCDTYQKISVTLNM